MTEEEIEQRVIDLKAGNGNFGEFACLLMRFITRKTAYHAGNAKKKGILYKELCSNAIIVLHDTVRTYIPEKGKFLALFQENLRWRTIYLIKRYNSVYIPHALADTTPTYSPLYILRDTGNQWKTSISDLEIQIDTQKRINLLEEKQRMVILYTMMEYHDVEIAKMMGISREYVRQIKHKAIQKLSSGKTGKILYSLLNE